MKNYENEELGTKKRKRSKTIATLSIIFMFVIGIGAVAIAFALSSSNVHGGGNISFEAKNVMATINGSLKRNEDTIKDDFETITFDQNTTAEDAEVRRETWQKIPFVFTDSEDVITFTITIKNDNTQNPMYVKFTDVKEDTDNVKFTYQIGEESAKTEIPDTFTIAKDTTTTITITMEVINESQSINANYSFTLKLSNTEITND